MEEAGIIKCIEIGSENGVVEIDLTSKVFGLGVWGSLKLASDTFSEVFEACIFFFKVVTHVEIPSAVVLIMLTPFNFNSQMQIVDWIFYRMNIWLCHEYNRVAPF